MNAAVTSLCVVLVAMNEPHNTSALLLAAANHASKLQHACKPLDWLLQRLQRFFDFGRC
jgi:hypothetical protein